MGELKPGFAESTEVAMLFKIFQSLGSPREHDWPELSTLPHYSVAKFPLFGRVSLPSVRARWCLRICSQIWMFRLHDIAARCIQSCPKPALDSSGGSSVLPGRVGSQHVRQTINAPPAGWLRHSRPVVAAAEHHCPLPKAATLVRQLAYGSSKAAIHWDGPTMGVEVG